MSLTFFDLIKEISPEIINDYGLYDKIFAWSVDYECQIYSIYEKIPQEAAYFWVNVLNRELYKFEKEQGKWNLVEIATPINY